MDWSMADITSFRTIIELWGKSREAMAAELPGTTATQISKWYQRDSIPPEYWAEVLGAERAIAAGVTADLLTALAARQLSEPEAARA
jgi:hypothetical protein